MISLYDAAGTCLVKRDGVTDVETATVWIDLLNPTDQEEEAIEKVLAIDVPTRAEMREIEASSRYYSEDGAHFMTTFVVYASNSDTRSRRRMSRSFWQEIASSPSAMASRRPSRFLPNALAGTVKAVAPARRS